MKKKELKTAKELLSQVAEVHAKRLLEYEKELYAARLEAERLRTLCVLQRIVHIQITQPVLRDAVAFIDRLQRSQGDWTVSEVQRLAEIRALVL